MDGSGIATARNRTGEVDCRALLESSILCSRYGDGDGGAEDKAQSETKNEAWLHCRRLCGTGGRLLCNLCGSFESPRGSRCGPNIRPPKLVSGCACWACRGQTASRKIAESYIDLSFCLTSALRRGKVVGCKVTSLLQWDGIVARCFSFKRQWSSRCHNRRPRAGIVFLGAHAHRPPWAPFDQEVHSFQRAGTMYKGSSHCR